IRAEAADEIHIAQLAPDHLWREPFVLDGGGDSVDQFRAITRQHAGVGQVPSPLEDHLERDVVAQPADERRLRHRDRDLRRGSPMCKHQGCQAHEVNERRKSQRQIAFVGKKKIGEGEVLSAGGGRVDADIHGSSLAALPPPPTRPPPPPLARLASIKTRWHGPRPPTAGGLNTGCRPHPWPLARLDSIKKPRARGSGRARPTRGGPTYGGGGAPRLPLQ